MPALEKADIVVPVALDQAAERKADPGHVLYAFARLKPGKTMVQAAAELQPVFNYSLSLAPPRFRSEIHLRVRSIRDRQMQDVHLIAWVLLGAVAAVLLISWANVASLLLTRAAARERELAVRAALGASTTRIIRQALTESLLLSMFGAVAGCALAEALLRIFVAVAPSSLPFLADARLDLRIVVFTAVLSLVSGTAFGLLPTMQRPRAVALGARTTPLRARALLRRSMVVAQIATSMILVAGAVLLVRSFINLQAQALGMQTRGVLTASVSLNRDRYATPQSHMNFFTQTEAALRRLPGVSAIGLSDTMPPGGYRHEQIFSNMAVAGRPAPTGETGGMVTWRWVTPAYFKALDIAIVRGQNFADQQRTSNDHFLILSRLLASRMFPDEDPIGKRVQPVPGGAWYVVQGVAADVKNAGLDAPQEPEFYRLRRNVAEDWQEAPSAAFVLKTTLAPKALAPWVRSQIAQIEPTVPVDIETLGERVGGLADRPRFETTLLSFFALTGLTMAMIGLYGVIAFMAMQRTQEIGIRMALGATRTDVLRLILREGIWLISIGGAVGLAGALALSRALKSMLFSIGPHDPVSFIAVTLMLALVALIATLIPARSAMKVDPVSALRWE
jgi:predicted permease